MEIRGGRAFPSRRVVTARSRWNARVTPVRRAEVVRAGLAGGLLYLARLLDLLLASRVHQGEAGALAARSKPAGCDLTARVDVRTPDQPRLARWTATRRRRRFTHGNGKPETVMRLKITNRLQTPPGGRRGGRPSSTAREWRRDTFTNRLASTKVLGGRLRLVLPRGLRCRSGLQGLGRSRRRLSMRNGATNE